MTQNRRIAITGGIGSGKSAVCRILKEKGFPVYSCDEISHELWQDALYRAQIGELFPDCTTGGETDRRKIADKVFSDEDALMKLNAFAHTKIMAQLEQKIKDEPIAFCEVPLLFEGGFESRFDTVIIVMRDRKKRVQAICLRDNVGESEALMRISKQFDYDAILPEEHNMVYNNGTLSELKKSVEVLLRALRLAPLPGGGKNEQPNCIG